MGGSSRVCEWYREWPWGGKGAFTQLSTVCLVPCTHRQWTGTQPNHRPAPEFFFLSLCLFSQPYKLVFTAVRESLAQLPDKVSCSGLNLAGSEFLRRRRQCQSHENKKSVLPLLCCRNSLNYNVNFLRISSILNKLRENADYLESGSLSGLYSNIFFLVFMTSS